MSFIRQRKRQVFIYSVNRTVATLLTARQNAACAFNYWLQASYVSRVVDKICSRSLDGIPRSNPS